MAVDEDDLPALPELSDEELEVRRRRYKEAKRAGLSIADSMLFADSDSDVSILRKLVGFGCPVAQIAAIVI